MKAVKMESGHKTKRQDIDERSVESPLGEQKVKSPMNIYFSPFRLLVIIMLSIFLTEAIIMFLFSILPRFSQHVQVIVDSLLLIVLVFPIAYFFMLRPLVSHITERKQAEETLQESEERFRSVAKNASDAIISIDSGGSIVFWNKAAETLFGYSPNEVINKPIAFIMPERFREVHQERLGQVVLGGKSKIIGKMVEVLGLRKDGSEFPIEVSLATWKSKESIFFTGIVRDITERKRAEAEREKLILELKEALFKVKQLSGMLPICASCKKIRDDKGYWRQIESYIRDRSEADFSHGICPECMIKLYPDFTDEEK